LKIHISILLILVLCLTGNLLGRDFERGDVNEDGTFDVADGVARLNHMFLGDVAYCLDAIDVNDDGIVNLGDAIGSLTTCSWGGRLLNRHLKFAVLIRRKILSAATHMRPAPSEMQFQDWTAILSRLSCAAGN